MRKFLRFFLALTLMFSGLTHVGAEDGPSGPRPAMFETQINIMKNAIQNYESYNDLENEPFYFGNDVSVPNKMAEGVVKAELLNDLSNENSEYKKYYNETDKKWVLPFSEVIQIVNRYYNSVYEKGFYEYLTRTTFDENNSSTQNVDIYNNLILTDNERYDVGSIRQSTYEINEKEYVIYELSVEHYIKEDTSVQGPGEFTHSATLTVIDKGDEGYKIFGYTNPQQSDEDQAPRYQDLVSGIDKTGTLTYSGNNYIMSFDQPLVIPTGADVLLDLYDDTHIASLPIDIREGQTEYTLTLDEFEEPDGFLQEGVYFVILTINDFNNESLIQYKLTGDGTNPDMKVYFPEMGESEDKNDYDDAPADIYTIEKTENSEGYKYTIKAKELGVRLPQEINSISLHFRSENGEWDLQLLHDSVSFDSNRTEFSFNSQQWTSNSTQPKGLYEIFLKIDYSRDEEGFIEFYKIADKDFLFEAVESDEINEEPQEPDYSDIEFQKGAHLTYKDGTYYITFDGEVPSLEENWWRVLRLYDSQSDQFMGEYEVCLTITENGYSFVLDDINLHIQTLMAGKYNVVLGLQSDESDTRYDLTNSTPIYFDTLAPIQDFELSYIDSEKTFYIDGDAKLPLEKNPGMDLIILDPEDGHEISRLNLHHLTYDGQRYKFSIDDFGFTDNLVKAGKYEVYLQLGFPHESAYGDTKLVYDMTTEPINFPQSHLPCPTGATIEVVEDEGLLITTADPSTAESQAWFENIKKWIWEKDNEEGHVNDGFKNTEITLLNDEEGMYQYFVGDNATDTFTDYRDDNGALQGLLLSKELIAKMGYKKGLTVYIYFVTPGYENLTVNDIYLPFGAEDSSTIELNVKQEEEYPYDIVVTWDNDESLEYMKNVVGFELYNVDDDYYNAGNYGEYMMEDYLNIEKSEFRIPFDHFRYGKLKEGTYIFNLQSQGYTKKFVTDDLEIKHTTVVEEVPSDLSLVLTSKGLVFRSKDRAYLEALNQNFDDTKYWRETNVDLIFTTVVNGDEIFRLSNQEGKVFDGVYTYPEGMGYYTYIGDETLRKSGAKNGEEYFIYIQAGGYDDLHIHTERFDLTKIINIYDHMHGHKHHHYGKHDLSFLDDEIHTLPNVNVSTTIGSNDETIEITGLSAATVVSDNKGSYDEATLIYENGENILVDVEIKNQIISNPKAKIDGYEIGQVDKEFDITVDRTVAYNDEENIIELPIPVLIEVEKDNDMKLKDGFKFMILKTHTNHDGNVTHELLEVTEENGKLNFYTSEFSTFQLVQVKEINNNNNNTNPGAGSGGLGDGTVTDDEEASAPDLEEDTTPDKEQDNSNAQTGDDNVMMVDLTFGIMALVLLVLLRKRQTIFK